VTGKSREASPKRRLVKSSAKVTSILKEPGEEAMENRRVLCGWNEGRHSKDKGQIDLFKRLSARTYSIGPFHTKKSKKETSNLFKTGKRSR